MVSPRPKFSWWLLLSICVPVAAFIVVHPVLGMGFNDDWGFYHMALTLARTGRISYEGWTTPMSLPHAFWGAALIRVFGFSWFVLRLGMLPFWAGSGLLVYLLGARIGLPPSWRTLASLVTTLSPLVVPLGASYHSDVTALGFVLLTIYCGMRVVEASSPMPAAYWSAAVFFAGALAGITRDIDWALPACIALAVVFLRWRERSLRIVGSVLFAIVLAAAVGSFRWHYSQPNAPAQESLGKPWPSAPGTAMTLLCIVLTICLVILPMIMPVARRIAFLRGWPAAMSMMFLGAAATAVWWERRMLFPPWIGNMFTEYGTFYNDQLVIGSRQVILQPALRLILGVTVIGISAVFAGAVGQVAGQYRGSLRKALAEREPLLVFAALTLPFAASYVGLLLLRNPVFLGFCGYAKLFDRYLLPIVPITALIAGVVALRLGEGRPGVIAIAVLAVMAVFAVANTHDLYAEHRALLAGAQWVTGQGVPRHLVSAGYEYDGWTQLEERGLPSGGGVRGVQDENILSAARKLPVTFWFQYATDAVTPCYYVVTSPQAVLRTVHEVDYRAWLAPRDRRILVQGSPGEFAAAKSCPVIGSEYGSNPAIHTAVR